MLLKMYFLVGNNNIERDSAFISVFHYQSTESWLSQFLAFVQEKLSIINQTDTQ